MDYEKKNLKFAFNPNHGLKVVKRKLFEIKNMLTYSL